MLLVEDEERMQLVRDIFNYMAKRSFSRKTAEKTNMLDIGQQETNRSMEQSIRTIINDSIL